MYTIKVNSGIDHAVERKKDKLLVDGKEISADIRQLGSAVYHVINDLKSYGAEVVSLDRDAKTAEIKVNGNTYTVSAKDQYDILLDQLGMSGLNNAQVSDVKAPMPGLVLKVFVKVGDTIKKGDNLFVLEAMKMENIIKSPADVIVTAIKTKPGDKVEKGQVLIRF